MVSFKYFTFLKYFILLALGLGLGFNACANPGLKKIDLNALEGGKVQIRLGMSESVSEPMVFSTENPARVILDFPGVLNTLSKENSKQAFAVGVVKKTSVVQADGRIRIIVDLTHGVPYEVTRRDKNVYLTLAAPSSNKAQAPTTPFAGIVSKTKGKSASADQVGSFSIKGIDFRRGDQGEGRIIVDLAGAKIPIDLKEEGSRITLRFMNTQLPERLERQLDVTDFGTPIKSINTVTQGKDVVMQVKFEGMTENMAYQADNHFTLEVKSLSQKAKDKAQKDRAEYTGERLSLNFQDIEVRAVLQLIADFTGLNIVTSDTVTGNVTLRLRNVPWDQALAIILKAKGLDKRQVGNVLLVGPTEEIAAREKIELQNSQLVEDLAPLRSEYIQINYAKAADIAALLKADKNSLLSARGSVSVDDRTNMLLVQDTPLKIEEVQNLVRRLDMPVKQVLIEARIVLANDDFEDALGVKFGGATQIGNRPKTGVAGNITGSDQIARSVVTPEGVSTANRLAVNLPQSLTGGGAAAAQFGLTVAKLPGGTILDMELMALEKEGLGKIVSSPRLVTSNQHLAYIESGEEIPYNEASSSGASSIAFKKAVLRLEVTPQITPDNHIILDLKVNQDSRGILVGTVPAINTRELQTKVLVANGETIVLGGIYEQTKNTTVTRVPFLGRLPMVGWLFKSENRIDSRKEMMIFVTPKIIQEGMGC